MPCRKVTRCQGSWVAATPAGVGVTAKTAPPARPLPVVEAKEGYSLHVLHDFVGMQRPPSLGGAWRRSPLLR